jgi:hypothetical protein
LAARLATGSESDHWGAVTKRGRAVETLAVDTLDSAGRLAARMFALGRPLVGRDILAGPLKQVLEATRTGRAVESEVLDAAGRYAMYLAQEMFDANWMNLAVEIHVLADHPMRAETLEQIIDLRAKAPVGDDDLIARFHEKMRKKAATMPLGDRLLLLELAELIPQTNNDE